MKEQIQTNIDLNTSCSIKEQSKSGVYAILNTVSNKFYIGSVTVGPKKNFRRRWQNHMRHLLNNKHCNIHLQGAFNIDRRESFQFLILEILENTDSILEREQYWIDTSKCLNPEIGYNKYPYAIAINKDYVVRKESKKKLSDSLKGKPRPMWMKLQYGKPILQYTLEGEFIREWYSATEAARVLNLHRQGIKDMLHGKNKTSGGFIWRYKNLEN